jgi:2-methylcitrate dehydratase PrpD
MSDPREASARNVQQLVAWAATVEPAEIPPAVLRKAACILADDLSAIIGARDEPEVVRLHQRTLERTGMPEATVWRGGHDRTDRFSAAVANAVAAGWLELDEGYRRTPCHGGLYVLPALLAHAEAASLPCNEILRSLVLAYEIVTRIASAWRQPVLTMQAHGRYASIGAAAAVGLALRLGPDALAQALGAAATLIGPAPRNHLEQGVLIRNAWAASGAWNGMMAIEWSACGIAGTPEALHDVYATVLGGEATPEVLVEELGQRWSVLEGYTKIYACCQHLHSAVEAALDLRARQAGLASPEHIDSVVVHCHPLALAFSEPSPGTTLGAKFSMPHAVAAALVKGDAGATAFSARSLVDERIARLREQVRMQVWNGPLAPPNDRPARVTVTLRGGELLSAECLSARGGPDRPLPDDTWVEKMRALAEPAYPDIVAVLQQIVDAQPRRLAQSWAEIAREICAPRAIPRA